MYVPRKEQNTRIEWNRLDEFATVSTSDSTMITRFDKNVSSGDWNVTGEVIDEKGRTVMKMYTVPKSLVFGRKKKLKKSDEELSKLSEMMRENNASKNNKS